MSEEFRSTVENAIPGSKDLLDVVLGPDSTGTVKKIETPIPPSKMKIPMTTTPPMPKLEKPVVAEEAKEPEKVKIVDIPPEEKITEKEPLESPPPAVLASPETPKATPIGIVVTFFKRMFIVSAHWGKKQLFILIFS